MRPVAFRREARVPFHYARSFLTTGGGRRLASVSDVPYTALPDHSSLYAQNLYVLKIFKRSSQSNLANHIKHRLDEQLGSHTLDRNEQNELRLLEERKANLYAAFKKRQPDQILSMMKDSGNRPIIEQMPDSVFVSAFLFLTPEHFLEPYKKILGRVHDHALTVKGYQSFAIIMRNYLTDLFLIFVVRSLGGNQMGLAEHTLLLRWAASVGDIAIALHTWTSMLRNSIRPDVECYNLLLASSLWDRVHVGKERYRLTVTWFYVKNRKKSPRNRYPGYRGFGVKKMSAMVPVKRLIGRMRKLNIPTNESTYKNMLLACGRVGYLRGIKDVLRAVWGIDVDKLADETEIHPPATAYPKSSPLYPSKDLLWTIAHAFGICKDLSSALRAVQFMSEQYNVKISPDTWLELFERAFVLSKRPVNKKKLTAPPPYPVVPFTVVHSIHDMMGLAPRHSRVHVYSKLARLAQKTKNIQEYSEVLETAYNLLVETRRERQRALLVLERSLGFSMNIDPSNTPFDGEKVLAACERVEVWKALREYEILRLEVMTQRLKVERILTLGVGIGRWREFKDPNIWSHHRLPEFLAEWSDFLPESFYVNLARGGGKVEFHGRTTYLHQNIRSHHYEPVRRSRYGELLDGEELEPMDDYLWSHIKTRMGEFAKQQPFMGFFQRNWHRMDAPGDNFLWIAEQEMPPIKVSHEKKFTRVFPDNFWQRMKEQREEEGCDRLFDVGPLIEKEMQDGSYRVDMAPFGRWC